MRALSLICAGLACLPLAAQEANLPVIRSTTQEVLLDAVVRDKKERLIRNLKPDEIRVLEDGVPQKLQTFRFTDTDSDQPQPAAAQPGAPAANAAAPNAPALNPLHNLNIVTIVFERMGPRSRLYAQQAAAEFLTNEFRSNTYGGVFSLDFRLNALQPYTNNQDLLRQAITRATTGTTPNSARIPKTCSITWPSRSPAIRAASTSARRWRRSVPKQRRSHPGRRIQRPELGWADGVGAHGLEADGNGQLRSGLALARRAAVAGPGAGRAARPQNCPAAFRRPGGALAGREHVPGHHRRGQPRQRERLLRGRHRACR
jgi:hypothetical protein